MDVEKLAKKRGWFLVPRKSANNHHLMFSRDIEGIQHKVTAGRLHKGGRKSQKAIVIYESTERQMKKCESGNCDHIRLATKRA